MTVEPGSPQWYTYTGNPADYPIYHRFASYPLATAPGAAKQIQDPYTPGGSGGGYYSPEAIAAGNASLGEIINYTGLARSLVGKYLNVLMELDLVRREISITAIKKTKKGIYSLKDNIFSFWFGFIFPYEDLLSLGRSEEVLIRISRDLNAYTGKAFEDIAKEFLWEAGGGNFSKIGRWWYKGEEIDIVALDEKRKEITFFECKWSRMNERDAVEILTDLKRKATMVKWHNSGRNEHYGIIAKAIEGKEKLREKGYQAFDLQDLNATFCT